MKSVLLSTLLLSTPLVQAGKAARNKECPPLGPVFPAASNPSSTKAIHTARTEFVHTLKQALQSGELDDKTSFSINVYSASSNETLFTYHYAAPALKGSLGAGVLNDDTIYRIGSLSKLYTAYTLLVADGMKHWNEPITNFVPELAAASVENSIDDSHWSTITVGALASHMGGVVRDCKYLNSN
jgi:CubicO group peptidase (beta-lactamase class C family)